MVRRIADGPIYDKACPNMKALHYICSQLYSIEGSVTTNNKTDIIIITVTAVHTSFHVNIRLSILELKKLFHTYTTVHSTITVDRRTELPDSI